MQDYKFIVQKPDASILYQVPYTNITIDEEVNKGISGVLNVSYPDIKKYANALNVEPDEYVCSVGNCLCFATYEEDDLLAWTDGDCSGCVGQTELTSYANAWLNGETEITQIEVTTAVDNWLVGISSC